MLFEGLSEWGNAPTSPCLCCTLNQITPLHCIGVCYNLTGDVLLLLLSLLTTSIALQAVHIQGTVNSTYNIYTLKPRFGIITLGFNFMILDSTQCYGHVDILTHLPLLSCCSNTSLNTFSTVGIFWQDGRDCKSGLSCFF